MVENVTVEQIRAWPIVNGWHVAPNGTHVKVGEDVEIADRVKLTQ